MSGGPVADGLQPSGDRLGGGRRRVVQQHWPTALAQHDLLIGGVRVSVVIERPERDRAGVAWRCRVRVTKGGGRIEDSQVVGLSAGAALRQAVELVSDRLHLSAAELLGDARIGAPPRPEPARTAESSG